MKLIGLLFIILIEIDFGLFTKLLFLGASPTSSIIAYFSSLDFC